MTANHSVVGVNNSAVSQFRLLLCTDIIVIQDATTLLLMPT